MKNYLKYFGAIAILLVANLASAQSDAISSYFAQYVEDERFTVVYISPKMFDMIAKLDLAELADNGDKEAKVALEMISDISGLRILTSEQTPNVFYKEAKSKLTNSSMESLMTVRTDDGENVNFYVKESGDTINELLLLVGGDEFVMLSIEGNIDLKKISKLAKALDVKGAEHLEELDNAQ